MGAAGRFTFTVILISQFIAALSALGMPPFFSLFLKKSFGSELSVGGIPIVGILFVIPSFFSSISSPFWGRLSDRYGKKRLLLRAQLGLTLSFILAGYARTTFQFTFALILQGLLGGTFAASKAYLSTLFQGERLAHGLSWMEASPRAALVLGPFLMGYLANTPSPVEIYRYLALLPLLATLLTGFLPSDQPELEIPAAKKSEPVLHPAPLPGGASGPPRGPSETTGPLTKPLVLSSSLTFQQVIYLFFAFGMSAVIISPYFNLFIHNRFASLSHGQLGLIFGLPHLIYLVTFAPINQVIRRKNITGRITPGLKPEVSLASMILAFGIQALSIFGQAQASTVSALIFFRLLSGISMTIILISLNYIISALTHVATSGRLFGRLEGSIRFSNFLGGLIASVGYGYLGSHSLFLMSSFILAVSTTYLVYLAVVQPKGELSYEST